jgi:hypothetical protein
MWAEERARVASMIRDKTMPPLPLLFVEGCGKESAYESVSDDEQGLDRFFASLVGVPTFSVRGDLEWCLPVLVGRLTGHVVERTSMPAQREERINVLSRCLRQLADLGWKVVGVGARDVVEGVFRVEMMLAWTIILQGSLLLDCRALDVAPWKRELFAWVHSKTGTMVGTFQGALWNDGRLFLGVVERLGGPSCLRLHFKCLPLEVRGAVVALLLCLKRIGCSLHKDVLWSVVELSLEGKSRKHLAFTRAAAEFGIPKLLGCNLACERAFLAVLTYVGQLRNYERYVSGLQTGVLEASKSAQSASGASSGTSAQKTVPSPSTL